MAGWDTLHNLILYELVQREEEGCDITAMRKEYECELIGAPEVELDVFYDRLMALEIEPQFPYDEPSDLENIRKDVKMDLGECPLTDVKTGCLIEFMGLGLGAVPVVH